MMNMKSIVMIGGVTLLSAVFINAVQTDAASGTVVRNETETKDSVAGKYQIKALKLPDNITFSGEQVPLNDPDVRERLDRELLVNTYWQSNAILLIKRANKFFPIIEPILKEKGVPDDFKYLAVIESGLTNAVSPAGATGFWQLLKSTAREYGLEVNDNVDERYHIEKSTEVACDYLTKAKERFGSWTMAAAAYNAGQFGMFKQLERQQVDDYYDVLLGEETGRYVFRILAIKEILSDPAKYGFHVENDDMYELVPTKEVKVDTAVTNFADFAQKFDINYKILKIHNPWLREANLNNASRKLYEIKIPKAGFYPPAE
ncbi:lytic transglycosylase domain-containing protein [Robertkochia solimangrovi]|uniref:lytic transglycosylase domain-containing protein n=1 Tax=Robertkochia solimangrovi TaxID=2213046 RepID=UPI001180C834|nr:lytic transglycosylase domain-containing protein [Robertkochia solimangrovi]TRZ43674.1 lytic transglycosylase domain-containing protein [Robertkochia solimangrovi]